MFSQNVAKFLSALALTLVHSTLMGSQYYRAVYNIVRQAQLSDAIVTI